MSAGWSVFIIAGTLLSLAWALWLLLANRTAATRKEGTTTPDTTGHSFDGIEEYDNPLPLWWVGLFVATIVFAIGYLAYFPGLGNFAGLGEWTSQTQWQRDVAAKEAQFAPLYARLASLSEAELRADHQARQIGRRLFVNHCSTCHGIGAHGTFGFPNLTDHEWQWGSDFEAIKATIREGRTAAMAPWASVLGGDAGVADMTQYVSSLSGTAHDATAAGRAAPQFQLFCIACHGPEGKGNPLFGAPDLTNDVWLYGGSADQVTFTLSHGRNGTMPAWGNVLGEQRVHILAGYVSGLQAQ